MPGLRQAFVVTTVATVLVFAIFVTLDLTVPALYGLMAVVVPAIGIWWDRRYNAPSR